MKKAESERGEMTFCEEVYETVKAIPRGKVATYGQIALMCGHRNAARAVGNALHVNPTPVVVPCHRVVNSRGMLAPGFAFGGADRQRALLEAEGVAVSDNAVDLEKYQWRG
ncbi:MAG: MGMT family protein [Roseburia sp.]|nr:MGMT family protein [Roseburia sp.]